MRFGRRNGDDVKTTWIERAGNPADVAAFAGRIPSFIAENDRNLFAVNGIVKLSEPCLQTVQFFLILLLLDHRRKIDFTELRHRQKIKLFFKRFADITALLQPFINGIGQETQGITRGLPSSGSIQYMPRQELPGLLHKLLIGITEKMILLMLPEVIFCHTPFRLVIISQSGKALLLLFTVNMQKELQDKISAVTKLTLKFIYRTNDLFILLFCNLSTEIFIHRTIHPAGIVKHDFSVFRNGFCIRIEERIALLRLRNNCRRCHIVKAGVDFADQLIDQAAFSGSRPTLDQNDHRESTAPDQLLLCKKLFPQGFDFCFQVAFVFLLGRGKILQHTVTAPFRMIIYRFRVSLITAIILSASSGFAICPFIPASSAARISSRKALAVMAIIGMPASSGLSSERIARAAV